MLAVKLQYCLLKWEVYKNLGVATVGEMQETGTGRSLSIQERLPASQQVTSRVEEVRQFPLRIIGVSRMRVRAV